MKKELHRLERIVADLEQERLMIYHQLKQSNNKINAIENWKKHLAKQLTRNAQTLKETERRIVTLKAKTGAAGRERDHALVG